MSRASLSLVASPFVWGIFTVLNQTLKKKFYINLTLIFVRILYTILRILQKFYLSALKWNLKYFTHKFLAGTVLSNIYETPGSRAVKVFRNGGCSLNGANEGRTSMYGNGGFHSSAHPFDCSLKQPIDQRCIVHVADLRWLIDKAFIEIYIYIYIYIYCPCS